MNKSDSIAALATALSKAQGEIIDAVKDKAAHKYKYADLGQILNIVRPLFSKHGLSFTQLPTKYVADNGLNYVALETVLMHESGEWLSSDFVMPVEASKGMSMGQCYGSVLTYQRRYALAALAGITQEDNDAQVNRQEQQNVDQKTQSNAHMVTQLQKNMRNCDTKEGLQNVFKQAYEWARDECDTVGGAALTAEYKNLKTLGGWA